MNSGLLDLVLYRPALEKKTPNLLFGVGCLIIRKEAAISY
jgi:hypothetical protein